MPSLTTPPLFHFMLICLFEKLFLLAEKKVLQISLGTEMYASIIHHYKQQFDTQMSCSSQFKI